MRVPIRKPGKYSNLQPDFHITEQKYNELQLDLKKLLEIKRPQAIAEVKRLALDGDFSENAAYQIAKGRLRGINRAILDIENRIKKAIIIKHRPDNNQVGIGNQVIVEVNGKEKKYLILGSSETDPANGIISHNSPIGSALLGKKNGAEIKIILNNKEIIYKIKKIF